jgi:hypothetical protein
MTDKSEDLLHIAICQAVGLMNMTPGQFGTDAHNILRQALVDYADAALSGQASDETLAALDDAVGLITCLGGNPKKQRRAADALRARLSGQASASPPTSDEDLMQRAAKTIQWLANEMGDIDGVGLAVMEALRARLATDCCGHASDCAVHNMPAMPNGPCDCGASPPAREVPPGWQPIETAPKSGLVDLWWCNRRYIDCYWDNICEEYRTIDTSSRLICIKGATHWQRPPAAPTDAGQGTEGKTP